MPPPKSSLPPTAKPNFGDHFDAWNSSSTGHQRAENRLGGSRGWRQSRTMKLSHQFKSGGTGGKPISDQVGAGSEGRDEQVKALIPTDVRERVENEVGDMFGNKVRMSEGEKPIAQKKTEYDINQARKLHQKRGIFDGLVIYINGSTHPLVSDHKLKHLLAENGAKLSIHLGRRSVTHVILGRPSGVAGLGAGGGLAGNKIEKEIRRVGGCGVKYVGVEWALESIKIGKRLPETRFSNLKIAAKGQKSVYNMFKKTSSTESSESTGRVA